MIRARALRLAGLLIVAVCLLPAGCGYSTRPGIAPHLQTIYIEPFVNKITLSRVPTREQPFAIYRHNMEIDLTNEIIRRYQFTGLLRPATRARANARLVGELVAFRRDALRYDASRNIEEWRLNLVVNLRFFDETTHTLLWEERGFVGDTTYFTTGPDAETEATALRRAITDLARRIVERTVDNW